MAFTLLLAHAPDYLQARFIDGGVVAAPPATSVMPAVTVSNADPGERGRILALVQITTDRFAYQRIPDGEMLLIIEKQFPS